jgi:hypothetical protein
MKLLNGHDLNKGDTVEIVGTNYSSAKTITHVSQMYLHISDLMFYKTSGKGANTAAAGLKLQRRLSVKQPLS